MAWSTPTATTVNQVVTSAFWNAQIQANFAALVETDSTNWLPWTPAYTAINPGAGSVSARYQQIGGIVVAQWRLTCATAPGIGTGPSMTPPVTGTGAGGSNENIAGVLICNDSGTRYLGVVREATSSLVLAVANTAGTYATYTALSATVPFTWATGDTLSFTVVYEAL